MVFANEEKALARFQALFVQINRSKPSGRRDYGIAMTTPTRTDDDDISNAPPTECMKGCRLRRSWSEREREGLT